jgi:phosphatidylinositol alpha-1,6-mannosyltransferase
MNIASGPPLRALLAVHDFPPMAGGIARAMGEIARHSLPESLVVSTGRMPGSDATDATIPSRVDRIRTASGRLRTPAGLAAWALRADRLVREQRTEFVWAGNLKPAGYVARWLHLRRRLPYGLMVYGFDVQRLMQQAQSSRLKRRVAKAIVGSAAGTVAISSWTAARFGELAVFLGLETSADKVRIIPPGVDSATFRPGLPTETTRERYGLDGRPWLLTAARLVPHKGVDLGIDVVGQLRREGLEVGYAVVGDGPERSALERLADARGLADQVRFLGRVPDADLPALYDSATAYLGLSRHDGLEVEGFGLSLLEAAACGLPVVAGEGGGTAEALANGVTGLLVDAGSVKPVAAAVRQLLQDPPRARAMGVAGRARVEREFTWRRVVHDLEQAAREFSGARVRPVER